MGGPPAASAGATRPTLRATPAMRGTNQRLTRKGERRIAAAVVMTLRAVFTSSPKWMSYKSYSSQRRVPGLDHGGGSALVSKWRGESCGSHPAGATWPSVAYFSHLTPLKGVRSAFTFKMRPVFVSRLTGWPPGPMNCELPLTAPRRPGPFGGLVANTTTSFPPPSDGNHASLNSFLSLPVAPAAKPRGVLASPSRPRAHQEFGAAPVVSRARASTHRRVRHDPAAWLR
jgi:hypothetical protein